MSLLEHNRGLFLFFQLFFRQSVLSIQLCAITRLSSAVCTGFYGSQALRSTEQLLRDSRRARLWKTKTGLPEKSIFVRTWTWEATAKLIVQSHQRIASAVNYVSGGRLPATKATHARHADGRALNARSRSARGFQEVAMAVERGPTRSSSSGSVD